MMTDPIADLLTRLRNAQTVKHPLVTIPYSKMKEAILKILRQEGFVTDFETVGEGIRKQLAVTLKYTDQGSGVIETMRRVSRPGRRVYLGSDAMKPVRNGLGLAIVSTSKGVMTDQKARSQKLGGEILLNIW